MRKLFLLIAVLLTMLVTVGYSQGLSSVKLRKNRPFAEQVTKPNTVYKIRHNFDLGGDTVAIPEGCVLKFKRGKIINGTLVLNNTYQEGKKGLQNVVLSGKCANNVLSSDLFVLDKTGKTDNSVEVQSMFNVGVDSVVFSKGTYSFSDIRVGNVSINANGSTFVSTLVQEGFSVINNIFVASNTDYFKLYDATIKGHLEGNPRIQRMVLSPIDLTNVKEVVFKSCAFKELRSACHNAYADGQYDYRGVSFSCHGCKSVLVENCEFYDIGPSEWTWIAPTASGTWDDVEKVHLKNNYIHNPKDDYERGNTPINVFSKNVVFEGNLLEYQKYAGSAFNLQSRNVIVHDNVVRNSHFKSVVDVCEYGDFCNDYVEIYNNDFTAYNSQAVVSNSKELIVRDNKFAGLSAVLAYATYYNPEVNHPACVDFADKTAKPNQKVLIEGNDFNCDLVDTTWVSKGKVVHGGYCSGITIQSIFCISDSVSIRNNKIYIRKTDSDYLDKRNHQPIFIRNARNISIVGNHIDSDVPAMGSKNEGAIYVLVYNRNRERDARLTEVESLKIVKNKFNIKSDGGTLYTTRISGYSENTADWRVKDATISDNTIIGASSKEQIYTTDGRIETLTVKGGRLDVKNSPAKIRNVRSVDNEERR
ncbi:MAG: hypothetical protein ACOYIG_01650 [Acetivibrionales bacterium]|jgi:hypothetical protein